MPHHPLAVPAIFSRNSPWDAMMTVGDTLFDMADAIVAAMPIEPAVLSDLTGVSVDVDHKGNELNRSSTPRGWDPTHVSFVGKSPTPGSGLECVRMHVGLHENWKDRKSVMLELSLEAGLTEQLVEKRYGRPNEFVLDDYDPPWTFDDSYVFTEADDQWSPPMYTWVYSRPNGYIGCRFVGLPTRLFEIVIEPL